jgi:hypothetical protein
MIDVALAFWNDLAAEVTADFPGIRSNAVDTLDRILVSNCGV